MNDTSKAAVLFFIFYQNTYIVMHFQLRDFEGENIKMFLAVLNLSTRCDVEKECIEGIVPYFVF